MDTTIITRNYAKANSLTRYFTGKPCRRGHVCERFTSNGACVRCVMKYSVNAHPIADNLKPYVPAQLWIVKGFPDNYHEALAKYLQQCVNSFCDLNAPNNLELANELGKLGGFRP